MWYASRTWEPSAYEGHRNCSGTVKTQTLVSFHHAMPRKLLRNIE
jgi:hypothetical protein